MRERQAFEVALRLLGRETMELLEAYLAANTALPRALQETLSGEEIAAIRVWQDQTLRRRKPPREGVTLLVDLDLPRPPD